MAEAKIPKATDAAKHKAGGGNVEICQLLTHVIARHRPPSLHSSLLTNTG